MVEVDRRARARPAPSVGRYVTGCAIVAMLVVGSVVARELAAGPLVPPLWLLALLGCGMLAANVSLVRLRLLGGVGESTTLLEVAVVPVLVLLTPAWAVAMTSASVALAEVIRTPGDGQKIVYNVATKVTAAAVGASVYHALVDTVFVASVAQVLAAAAAVFVFLVVNAGAFAGLVALLTGRALREVMRDDAPAMVGLDAGVAATGVLVVILAVAAPIALPLLAVPTILDRLRARARREGYELNAAKDAAEQANRAKSEFLSRMSHELRTPLNAILGFGQLLELDDDLSEDARQHVAPILRSGRHLLELIEEVLDISRIEAGRIDLEPAYVPVAAVLTECLDLVRPIADQRHVGTHVELEREDLAVMADPQRLKQVLINLLSNAVKYNRDGGEILLTAGRHHDGIHIAVADTGEGIGPDDLDRLFVPFERLQAASTDTEGTGLGLSISRRLTEAMDGHLTATSQPGQGSTFTIVLPAADTVPVDADAEPASAAPDADMGLRLRVVYIEDNPSNVELVRRVLAQRPATSLCTAPDASVGLAMVRDQRPDLVLVDLQLPGLDGEEILRELQDDPGTAHIPVVIVSAEASTGRKEELLAVGAVAYLVKPLDIHALLALVDEVSAAVVPAGPAPAR